MKVAEVTTSKAFRSYKEAREEVVAEQSPPQPQPVEEVKAATPVTEEPKPEV